ncbi:MULTISPECIES: DUF389 domain-containing protein [unclassified Cellulophaga]|uniref:DUF389 domain-containing protein n=1 Tax=unclassified Cellulophaga TaxID=2634405 RepID=UPI0026E18560|nr:MULTISPECIES: DUF389 domain-containing protein [unclassified Cellulophaga]MDO6490493.1 DUF389 domain-containing protein [Cellulophaga sp. 2_MG-2023]MDO6494313.1 DUF389 domain-containing protein [Cellulophaga sp. 3_MG-2023]
MSNNTEQNNNVTGSESSDNVKKDFQGLLGSTKKFLKELLDIRNNTDQEATRESIVADIPFKGHTSWILICSIFIASIGLNANSTAVVIGAMLISPLMGPILGMGLSLAINDIDTLRRSLKNFGVMVVLSILTAFLFFKFFPLRDESSELLARTAPDIRDVLIAFFGGLALVIARAKKGTIASVIFGVAIATALMPPLCTVGFGLAIGNWDYATGAMYLFTINTIFIALATFLVIKILRFPMVRYANSERRRLISRLASIVAILVMVPASWTFFKAWEESQFKSQAQQFITENIAKYKFAGNGLYLNNLTNIEYHGGDSSLFDKIFRKNKNEQKSVIEVMFMGEELVPDNIIASWNEIKNEDFKELANTDLKIIQGSKNKEVDQIKYVEELYQAKKAELMGKEEKIALLEKELTQLQKIVSKQIPFNDVSAEAKANYENLASIGYSYTIRTDFKKVDTIPVFEINWKPKTKSKDKQADAKKIADWLKLRLKDKNIQVRELAN